MKSFKLFFSILVFSLIIANVGWANLSSGTFTVQQKSNARYIDAYDYEGTDYTVVTRTKQSNNTQRWIFRKVDIDTYTIQQKSTGRYLDAHESQDYNYTVVTRSFQNNNTQRWIIKKVGTNAYTIQQKSTGRYLDAHTTPDNDYSLVTRTRQQNNTQVWVLTNALPVRKPVSAINKAVSACLFGPDAKSTKVFGHTFNFERKKTSIHIDSRTGIKTVYINFSYHRTARFDDQYHYTAKYNRNNELMNWEYRINKGGFLPKTSSSLGSLPFQPTSRGLSRAAIDNLAAGAQRTLQGRNSWQNAAKEIAFIISQTAVSYKR